MTVTPSTEIVESPAAPDAPVPVAPPRHVLGDLIWSPSRTARLLIRIAVSVVFLFGLWVDLTHPIAALQQPIVYRKDFLQDYLLAQTIVERSDPYPSSPAVMDQSRGWLPVSPPPFPTPHPPTVGLLLVPLTFLDYSTAATVWLLLETACLVASVHILSHVVGRRLGILGTLITSAIALVWYPITLDLMLGQFMLPILLLLAGARHAMQSDRQCIAGVLIGLSILIKPVAWPLLLVFVVRRNWRPLAAGLSTTLVGYTVAVGAIGFSAVFAYLTRVLPLVTGLYHAAYRNISAWTVGWRVFDGMGSSAWPDVSVSPLVQWPEAAAVVSAGLPALILLVSLVAIRRQQSLVRSFGLMICVSILVSPISWAHYLVLAAIPVAEVTGWLVRHNFPSRETNAALLVAIALFPGNATGDGWTSLALTVASKTALPSGGVLIPFAPGLLTLGPAVAVAALGVLLLTLPDIPNRIVNLDVGGEAR